LERKILFLLMALVLLFTLPTLAAVQYEQLPDGKFEVTFTFESAAEEVYLAGQFNNWAPKDPNYKMTKNADGIFEISIVLEKGSYEYKFVENGSTWKADPDNPEKVGGYGNSLLVITSGKMSGEFELGGEIINELSREGKEGPVAFNNDVKLKLEGVLQEEKDDVKTDKVEYMAEIKAEAGLSDIETYDTEAEFLTLDKVYVNKMDVTMLGDLFDVSLQANMEDKTNSYDYLGLVDANTANDDRKYDTTNLNEFGDSRRIRLEGSKEGFTYNAALTEYTGDVYDLDSNKKYVGLLNFKKEFKDPITGQTVGSTGFTGSLYQPVVAGTYKEMAKWAAVFGEYEVAKNLIVRGEYAYVPRGIINETLSGTEEVSPGTWKFTFDPRDYELEADDISDVHLAGEFNSWDPSNTDYTLTKNEEEGIWEGTFDVAEGSMFKWIVDGEWTPDGMGNDLVVKEREPDDPLKDGSAMMAEVNYKVFDARRSFRTSSNFYKFDTTAGVQVVENGAYLRLAENDLARNHEVGKNKFYLHGYYYPLPVEDLKLTWSGHYLTPYDDPETLEDERENQVSYVITPGFDYPEPVEGLEYIKGDFSHGKLPEVGEWKWEDNNLYNDNGIKEFNRLFVEAKTKPVGPFNYFLANVNHENALDITEIFAEAELNIPVEQIAYIKGNLDYKYGDKYDKDGETIQREPRVWVEGKFHHIPGIQDYITHMLVNYETDLGHIIDHGWYNDDDNDWKNKVYAETKLITPELEGFEVLVKLESQNIEEEKLPTNPGDLDENLDAKYVENGQFIDWYTIVTLETGYDFPYGIHGDLTIKYDLNHNEISRYEDDALKVGLSKPLSDRTTLKASYNSKHPDYNSEEYVSLMLETLF